MEVLQTDQNENSSNNSAARKSRNRSGKNAKHVANRSNSRSKLNSRSRSRSLSRSRSKLQTPANTPESKKKRMKAKWLPAMDSESDSETERGGETPEEMVTLRICCTQLECTAVNSWEPSFSAHSTRRSKRLYRRASLQREVSELQARPKRRTAHQVRLSQIGTNVILGKVQTASCEQ